MRRLGIRYKKGRMYEKKGEERSRKGMLKEWMI